MRPYNKLIEYSRKTIINLSRAWIGEAFKLSRRGKLFQLSKVHYVRLVLSFYRDSTNMTNEDEESTSGPNKVAKFATLILLAFKVLRSSNDDVAEIERMRGIINSFGFYPEYSHFHHTLNAFSRFTFIFIF